MLLPRCFSDSGYATAVEVCANCYRTSCEVSIVCPLLFYIMMIFNFLCGFYQAPMIFNFLWGFYQVPMIFNFLWGFYQVLMIFNFLWGFYQVRIFSIASMSSASSLTIGRSEGNNYYEIKHSLTMGKDMQWDVLIRFFIPYFEILPLPCG